MKTLYKRRQQLTAMRKLLKHYKSRQSGKGGTLTDCPLCIVLGFHGDCGDCVWYWETGKDCSDYALARSNRLKYRAVSGDPATLRSEGDEGWVDLRIRQLTKWIKKWKEVKTNG